MSCEELIYKLFNTAILDFDQNLLTFQGNKNNKLTINYKNLKVCLYFIDDEFYSEEESFCTLDDMLQLDSFSEFNKCPECNDAGIIKYQELVCSKPASYCCGGCYEPVEETCECNLKPF
jgi:hypothetical protein